ncbi:MAG: LysM peptidoglycan-binding domain-containing protein [bacterium]
MASRSDFEQREWQLLINAPHLIYSLLTGGADEVTRAEASAMHKFLEGFQTASPLIQEVLAASKQMEPGKGVAEAAQPGGIPTGSAMQNLEQIGNILSHKVNRLEADEFRNFLMTLGRKIAEASSEKFLGLGKKVSGEEASTLDSIAAALKTSVAEAAPGMGERIYEVKPGDTLSKIAMNFYGNASDWPKIYEANKEQIDNPDLIKPGQKFRIP